MISVFMAYHEAKFSAIWNV